MCMKIMSKRKVSDVYSVGYTIRYKHPDRKSLYSVLDSGFEFPFPTRNNKGVSIFDPNKAPHGNIHNDKWFNSLQPGNLVTEGAFHLGLNSYALLCSIMRKEWATTRKHRDFFVPVLAKYYIPPGNLYYVGNIKGCSSILNGTTGYIARKIMLDKYMVIDINDGYKYNMDRVWNW